MDMILLPGGALRAQVWEPELREAVVRDVSDELPYFLRTIVRLHDQVTLKDLLLLAEQHRDFLLPLFTDLLDDFVDEVKRPAETDDLCELDYLEICWECWTEGKRFDLQPILVGRIHKDDQIYSVEAVPTYAMGHLPVMLRTVFELPPPDAERPAGSLPAGEPGTDAPGVPAVPGLATNGGFPTGLATNGSFPGDLLPGGLAMSGPVTHGTAPNGSATGGEGAARELRREFLLFDVFDAVLAEITFHGDPTERDRWWREIGSRGFDGHDLEDD